MAKALDFESRDCRFESGGDQFLPTAAFFYGSKWGSFYLPRRLSTAAIDSAVEIGGNGGSWKSGILCSFAVVFSSSPTHALAQSIIYNDRRLSSEGQGEETEARRIARTRTTMSR